MGRLRAWLLNRQPDSETVLVADPPVRPADGTAWFAVVDVETTGLSPKRDRILEIAVVRLDAHGRVVGDWSTRVNPEGPVGATHIHGITAADVAHAPRFHDIAPVVAAQLSGLPVIAHNATFDLAFMRAEFVGAGWAMPWVPALCTMQASTRYLPQLDRRRLVDCCAAARVTLDHAHSALGDARATAGLFAHYLELDRARGSESDAHELHAQAGLIGWPAGPTQSPVPRPAAAPRSIPMRFTPPRPKQPALIAQLTTLSLADVIDEGLPDGTSTYLEMLLQCLEDAEISDSEATVLAELAEMYALTPADVAAAHRAFLIALAHRAVDDGHVSRDERAELATFASLLNLPPTTVSSVIERADAARLARKSAGLGPLPDGWPHGEPLRVGDKVVFTGCDETQRQRLEERAESLGVRIVGGVSRQTSLLVTDGSFAGGKLAKAVELGTRQVHPDVFDEMLAHLQPALPAPARVARPAAQRRMTDTSVAPDASAVGAPTTDVTPALVRTWAIARGMEVGDRGRLPRELLDAYRRWVAENEMAG